MSGTGRNRGLDQMRIKMAGPSSRSVCECVLCHPFDEALVCFCENRCEHYVNVVLSWLLLCTNIDSWYWLLIFNKQIKLTLCVFRIITTKTIISLILLLTRQEAAYTNTCTTRQTRSWRSWLSPSYSLKICNWSTEQRRPFMTHELGVFDHQAATDCLWSMKILHSNPCHTGTGNSIPNLASDRKSALFCCKKPGLALGLALCLEPEGIADSIRCGRNGWSTVSEGLWMR